MSLIKTNKTFTFCDNASTFVNKNKMISATRASAEPRSFLIGLRHRQKVTKADQIRMDKGKEVHEKYQEGLKTVTEYGYIDFRRDLHLHKRIRLKELDVISPNNAVYGVIDDIMMEFTEKGELRLWVTDYKARWTISSLYQLINYIIILTDSSSLLVHGVPYKRKSKRGRTEKREIGYLFPDPLSIKSISIKARIYNYNSQKEQCFEDYVINSKIAGEKEGIYLATLKKLHLYQFYMLQKVVDLRQFPHDKNGYCCKGYPHICPRVPYNPKDKQRFFGKKLNLIKNKPQII